MWMYECSDQGLLKWEDKVYTQAVPFSFIILFIFSLFESNNLKFRRTGFVYEYSDERGSDSEVTLKHV